MKMKRSEFVKMYQGMKIIEMSEKTGVPVSTLKRYAKELGITKQKGQPRKITIIEG